MNISGKRNHAPAASRHAPHGLMLLERPEDADRKHESMRSVTGCRGCMVPFSGDVHHFPSLNHRPLADRVTKGGTDVLFRAAGPALVEAGISYLNGEVVT